MKILSVAGCRPEIIRLSVIMKKLDKYFNHKLIHTGQNYDEKLSDIFFKELEIRKPDYCLNIHTSDYGEQIGSIFTQLEQILTKEQPDKILILGDTNSALSAIIAEKMKIPVFHMEAGNRCHDRAVPEEINRKIVDSICSYNLPYTQLSKENLIKDGMPKERIFVTGNPINEVINYYNEQIESSTILEKLGLKRHGYFLSTFHRAENVDNEMTLRNIVTALGFSSCKHNKPVICSIHPRTKSKIELFKITAPGNNVHFHEPFGFFDFIKLEKNASVVISDSGTVCEDASILRVPNVIIRNSTERPEVIECGASVLCGLREQDICDAITFMTKKDCNWKIPEEYLYHDVSDRICTILKGNYKWVKK
jgi:UDP-N-acetylglucosamine 2-epimerase (non-hydrolysing)